MELISLTTIAITLIAIKQTLNFNNKFIVKNISVKNKQKRKSVYHLRDPPNPEAPPAPSYRVRFDGDPYPPPFP